MQKFEYCGSYTDKILLKQMACLAVWQIYEFAMRFINLQLSEGAKIKSVQQLGACFVSIVFNYQTHNELKQSAGDVAV